MKSELFFKKYIFHTHHATDLVFGSFSLMSVDFNDVRIPKYCAAVSAPNGTDVQFYKRNDTLTSSNNVILPTGLF